MRRAAQSMCLLLTADELTRDAHIVRDSLDFPAKIPDNVSCKARVKVKVDNTVPTIVDV